MLSKYYTPQGYLLSRWLDLHTGTLAHESGSAVPALLVCWPYARINKYQALLYGRAVESGFFVFPLTSLDDLESVSWPGTVVFHAHWFASIYAHCVTEDDALVANIEVMNQLGRFQARTNARLLWTAHNLLPHNTVFPKAALELRRRVFAEFDIIHFLANLHLDITSSAYGLSPKQHFVVPHMTYENAYPDYMERDEARALLGLSPKELVYLTFGAIQPYKGLDELIPAFREMVRGGRPSARLIIAGISTDTRYADELDVLVDMDPNIIFDPRNIPDHEVQIFLRAADVVVLPYKETLNSGAAALAATFSRPIVAPSSPAFSGSGLGTTILYSSDEPHGLRVALEDFYDGPKLTLRPIPDIFRPRVVSAEFFKRLKQSLDL